MRPIDERAGRRDVLVGERPSALSTYAYRVLDRNSKILEGTIEAPSVMVARTELRQKFPSVLSLEEKPENVTARLRLRKVSGEALSVCVRQIATMLNAGIPLSRALHSIAKGAEGVVGDIFATMSVHVDSGASLSKAMRKHPKAFDDVFIRIVESGEVSGRMDSVLTKLADLMEKSVKLRKKVIASFTYPAVLGGTALGTLGVFVFYVLPLMQPVFHSLGVELPLATRIVLGIASAIRNPYIVIPGIVFLVALSSAAWVVLSQMYRSADFRFTVHGIALKLPVLGPLIEKSTCARVLFTLSTMLESGVSMGPSLMVVEKVAGNEVMSRRLARARQAMIAGGGVFESLVVAKAFPDMVLQMIKAGEEAGALDGMMRRVAAMYEEEVDISLSTLAQSLEPIILCGMGGIVAFVTLAAFMPMVKLLSEL